MALPKKRKPLADKERIAKALEDAGANASDKNQSVTEPKEKPDVVFKKRVGRPPLKEDRSARMSFYLAPETLERFDLAFMQEQYKQATKGKRIDKSLLLESIIKEWLVKNEY